MVEPVVALCGRGVVFSAGAGVGAARRLLSLREGVRQTWVWALLTGIVPVDGARARELGPRTTPRATEHA